MDCGGQGGVGGSEIMAENHSRKVTLEISQNTMMEVTPPGVTVPVQAILAAFVSPPREAELVQPNCEGP